MTEGPPAGRSPRELPAEDPAGLLDDRPLGPASRCSGLPRTAGRAARISRTFTTAQVLGNAGVPVSVACDGWTGRLDRART